MTVFGVMAAGPISLLYRASRRCRDRTIGPAGSAPGAGRGPYDCGASQLLTIIRSLLAMATCPDCDAEIDVDEFDVDRGDELSCPECGSNLEVVAVSPVELEPASDDNDDDDSGRRQEPERGRGARP